MRLDFEDHIRIVLLRVRGRPLRFGFAVKPHRRTLQTLIVEGGFIGQKDWLGRDSNAV